MVSGVLLLAGLLKPRLQMGLEMCGHESPPSMVFLLAGNLLQLPVGGPLGTQAALTARAQVATLQVSLCMRVPAAHLLLLETLPVLEPRGRRQAHGLRLLGSCKSQLDWPGPLVCKGEALLARIQGSLPCILGTERSVPLTRQGFSLCWFPSCVTKHRAQAA